MRTVPKTEEKLEWQRIQNEIAIANMLPKLKEIHKRRMDFHRRFEEFAEREGWEIDRPRHCSLIAPDGTFIDRRWFLANIRDIAEVWLDGGMDAVLSYWRLSHVS